MSIVVLLEVVVFVLSELMDKLKELGANCFSNGC